MNRIRMVAVVAVLALGLSACQTAGGQKQTLGTLMGGGLGALAGSQIGSGRGQLAAVAIGTLGGAFLGSEVGRSLDRADLQHQQQAFSNAGYAPIGQPVVWSNPDSGNYGSVTPVREGRHNVTGAYCREYQQTVTVGGRLQEAYGTACQQPDGTWKVI